MLSREPEGRDLVEIAHLLLPDQRLVTLGQLVPQPFEHPHLLVRQSQPIPDLPDFRRSLMAHPAKALTLAVEVCDPISMPLEFADRSTGPQGVCPIGRCLLTAPIGVVHGSRSGAFGPFRLRQFGLYRIPMPGTKIQNRLCAKAECLHVVAACSPSIASGNPHVVSAG